MDDGDFLAESLRCGGGRVTGYGADGVYLG